MLRTTVTVTKCIPISFDMQKAYDINLPVKATAALFSASRHCGHDNS